MVIVPELPNGIAENHKAEILEWCNSYVYAVLTIQDKKNEWLKIHRREDNVKFREEQLKLRQTYDSTQNKIKQLGIEREEVNQHWDRRELDFRRRTLKFIGKNW